MDILINNAFRITGLPITASYREITNRIDELLTFQKVGKLPSYDTDFEWMGKINRTEDSIREAANSLQTIEIKIQHALFWFWDFTPNDHQAFLLLKDGKLIDATRIWNMEINDIDKFHISQFKNLSTILLLILIDKLKKKHTNTLPFLSHVFEYWNTLTNNEKFWSLLETEIYKSNFLENSKNELKNFIFTKINSNIKPFINKYIHNDLSFAKHYLNFIDKSHFSVSKKKDIKNDLLQPYISEIESLIDNAQKSKNEAQKNGLAIGNTLYTKSLNSLKVIQAILDKEDSLRKSISDKIAEELFECSNSFDDETRNIEASRQLILKAKELSSDPLMINNLERNLSQLNIYTKLEKYSEQLNNHETTIQVYQIGKQFADEIKKELHDLDKFFDKINHIYKEITEHCAYFIRNCGIQIANDYQEYEKGKELIELAIDMICYTSENDNKYYTINMELYEKLNSDKETLSENIITHSIFGTCWYCKTNKAKEDYVCKVPMNRITARILNSIQYEKIIVEIPRCAQCKNIHKRKQALTWGGGIVGGITGFLVGGPVGALIGIGIGAGGGNIAGSKKEIKTEHDIKEFPPAKKLFMEGWNIGEEPSS
ncbi:MAG: hypothetical protein ACFFDN_37140 [Candidatus Hodarchaeota archaeon]